MANHAEDSDAVHEQPVVVVTLIDPLPPPAVKLLEDGEIEKLHDGAPSCEMLKVFPAIVSCPLLDEALVLAATEYWTVPFPVPADPLVIVIHDRLLLADQLQLDGLAVTATDPVPPWWSNDFDVGLIE